MYFKKLELVGFKSFLDKTTLHFEPGITAIVGPNGTGKSNVFDSIRWVLGEQSVKSLRGSEMQDVIFNGTDSKEPLSLAEVSLTFDNGNKFFPVEHDEVVVTRRVFRSGESEYLLNKTQVRLKDVLDLLMGTGIGAESYSLVAQGKIDLVLSSRPEDRRLVFDEASGITKYKSQKKEAMRKLEETQQNLVRVNDIIVEVKRQIGSLERQANKARKYKEVFEELKNKEISLAVLKRNDLSGQKEDIISQLKELEIQESRLLEVIKEQESKVSNRQQELKTLEENMMAIKNEVLNLGNSMIRNKERINFNQEKIKESQDNHKYLENQIQQTKNRLILDEEKLKQAQAEYATIHQNIEDKTQILKDKENELDTLSVSIKTSLENITRSKKNILELVSKIANIKNELADALAKHNMYLARQRRLQVEKAKVNEERAIAEDSLNHLNQELTVLEKSFADLNQKISDSKQILESEISALNNIDSDIRDLEKKHLAYASHKEFLEKLKSEYEGIGESLNAVIYLDKLPKERISGLVIKIKDYPDLEKEASGFKLSGEAKPVDLDTQKINAKINEIEHRIDSLKSAKILKENRIKGLNKDIAEAQQLLRSQEMVLVNKKANQQTLLEQFQKIKEEEEMIAIELSDTDKELSALTEQKLSLQSSLSLHENEQKQTEDSITQEQNNITLNANLKEKVLVAITQAKTELVALHKRIDSDETTLKILEDAYNQDKQSLINLEKQLKDNQTKKESLESEIKDLEEKIEQAKKDLQKQDALLKEKEEKYQEVSEGSSDVVKKIETERLEHDKLKNRLYELQMQNKDIDFKYQSIKDRMSQIYKIELESIADISGDLQEAALAEDIQRLRDKLDSYGSVNLVAIEEYDELKQRYDFLIQQQNDLFCAKESLHEVILKINRTTKKMFLETFEQTRTEFRNYFRLLFNCGDAQLFLIDEQDPLESGIEIICRPPGKKLQNVLLLSGGEKALSAIALIFAIFKVKPSPFCVLDEIDAALDEANVDRFSRLLQEFAQESQFIVITHNKRTIANADVMYGITMEESGVSKIVSVKFAQNKSEEDKRPGLAVPEPV